MSMTEQTARAGVPARPIRPVRLRDAPYGDAAVVYAISGVSESAIDGLVDALAAYLSLPASLEFRARLGKDPSETVIRERARAAVIHVDPGLELQDLMMEARSLGFDGLPTRIAVSGDSIAIVVNHGFMDGGPILEYVVWLLSAAVGATAKRDVREPLTHPFREGFRKVGRAGFRSFLADRRAEKPQIPQAPVPRDPAGAVIRRTIALHLSPDLVDRVTSVPTSGPATAAAHIASTGVAALARVHTGDGDPLVTVPVDLRRFVGNKRVLGNFMGVGSHNTMFGSSWQADALTERLVSATADGSAMVAGYVAVLRWALWQVRRAVRRRPGSAGQPTYGDVALFVPLLGVRKGPPQEVWSTEKPHVVAIGSLGANPGGIALNVLSLGKEVHLSVGDETGAFDLDRFEEAFLAEVEARHAARPTKA